MASLEDFRAKFPSLRSLNDYEAISRIAETHGADPKLLEQEFGVTPIEDVGDVGRSVSNAGHQLKGILGAGKQLVGEGLRRGLGSDPVSDYLVDSGQENIDSMRQGVVSKDTDNLDVALTKGVGGMVDWAQYNAAQQIPNLVELGLVSAGGAGLGLAAARRAGVEAAKRAAWGAAGATAGQVGAAGAHAVGEVGGEAIQEKGLQNVDFNRVLPAIAAHTGLEFVGDRIALGAMKKMAPAQTFKEGGLGAVGKTFGKQYGEFVAKEAPTEAAQTVAERFGAEKDLTSEEAQRAYFNAAGAAAAGGLIPVSVGTARAHLGADQNKPADDRTKTERFMDGVTDGITALGPLGAKIQGKAESLLDKANAKYDDEHLARILADAPKFSEDMTDAEVVAAGDTDLKERLTSAFDYANKVRSTPNAYNEDERTNAEQYIQSLEKGLDPETAMNTYRSQLVETKRANNLSSAFNGFASPERKASKQAPTGSSGEPVTHDANKAALQAKRDLDLQTWNDTLALVHKTLSADKKSRLRDTAQKEDVRNGILGLGQWVKQKFQIEDEDGNTRVGVPDKFVEVLGEDAPRVVKLTIDTLKEQGLIDTETAKLGEKMVKLIDAKNNANRGSLSAVVESFTPLAREELGKELPRVAQLVQEQLRLLNKKGGKLNADDEATLSRWFGPNKNKLLRGFSDKQQKLDKQFREEGSGEVFDEKATGEEVQQEGGAFQQMNDDELAFSTKLAAHESMWRESELFDGEEKTKYVGTFDTRQPGTKDELRSKLENDFSEAKLPNTRVQEIGIVEAAEYKHADDAAALDAALQSLREKYPEMKTLAEINKAVRTIQLTSLTENDKSVVKGEEFANLQPGQPNNKWAVSAGKNGEFGAAEHGVLVFERVSADGETHQFNTSTSKLVKRGRQLDKTDGRTAKEASSDMLRALSSGITALFESKNEDGRYALSGRVGYREKAGGPVTWLDQNEDPAEGGLPADLRLPSGATIESFRKEIGRKQGDISLEGKEPNKKTKKYNHKTNVDKYDKDILTSLSRNGLIEVWEDRVKALSGAKANEASAEVIKAIQYQIDQVAEEGQTRYGPEAWHRKAGDGSTWNAKTLAEMTNADGTTARAPNTGVLTRSGPKANDRAAPINGKKTTGQTKTPYGTPTDKQGDRAKSLPATEFEPKAGTRIENERPEGERNADMLPDGSPEPLRPTTQDKKTPKLPEAQQKWLMDTLRKGVPAFLTAVKNMNIERRAGIHAALKQMVSVTSMDSPFWRGSPPTNVKEFTKRANMVLVRLEGYLGKQGDLLGATVTPPKAEKADDSGRTQAVAGVRGADAEGGSAGPRAVAGADKGRTGLPVRGAGVTYTPQQVDAILTEEKGWPSTNAESLAFIKAMKARYDELRALKKRVETDAKVGEEPWYEDQYATEYAALEALKDWFNPKGFAAQDHQMLLTENDEWHKMPDAEQTKALTEFDNVWKALTEKVGATTPPSSAAQDSDTLSPESVRTGILRSVPPVVKNVAEEVADGTTRKANAQAVNKNERRVLFAPQWHEGFARALDTLRDAFTAGGTQKQEAGNRPILLGRTPVVLRAIQEADGSKPFKRSPAIVGSGATVYLKGINEHALTEHKDSVPYHVLRNLPALLANPIAVFKSSENSSDQNSFKILIDAKSSSGLPVVVALKPNTAMKQLGGEEVHFQASIIPVQWGDVRKWSEVGLLRYRNEGSPLANVVGTNSREVGAQDAHTREGFDASIGVAASSVKVLSDADVRALPESAWSAQSTTGKQATQEEQDATTKELVETLGPKLAPIFKNFIKGAPILDDSGNAVIDPTTGEPLHEAWSGEFSKRGIEIALNAMDVLSVGRHESIHQLFQWLSEHGAENVKEVLENAAMNPAIQNQLRRLLNGDAAAIAQLSNKEEAAAYLYQFWRADPKSVTLGPKTETFFQRVSKLISELMNIVRGEVRDMQHAEQIMQAFSAGTFKEGQNLSKVETALAEQRAKDASGNALVNAFNNQKQLQKYAFTNMSVFDDTKIPALIALRKALFVKTGEDMATQGVLEAAKQQFNIYTSKLDAIFKGVDAEDLPAILKELQSETPAGKIGDPVVKAKVVEVRAFLKEMYAYIKSRDIKRLNDETNQWEEIPEFKNNYFPWVMNMDKLTSPEGGREFVEKLMKIHVQELKNIADQENAKRSNDSDDELYAATKIKDREITPEDVAEAILARYISAGGSKEIHESSSDLGITPYARSINKRTLAWLDRAQFTEFTNHDLIETLSNYTAQITKRGEYTSKLGNGGEKVKQALQQAYISMLLKRDQKRVDAMNKLYERKVQEWGDTPADKRGEYPTFRGTVENEILMEKAAELSKDKRAVVTPSDPTYKAWLAAQKQAEADAKPFIAAQIAEAMQELKPVTEAVMAAEGTLGRDIKASTRDIISTVMVYQSARTMALSLFASFGDPVGIIVNGGDMKQAWTAFVRGMHDVKRVFKEDTSYTPDAMEQLAMRIGTAEARLNLDSLGQSYSSLYLRGKFSRINQFIFKYNGMQAYNRAMRIQATGIALDFLTKHLTSPNQHSTRRLAEYGLTEGKDAYMKDGELDTYNPAVQAALMRWVNDAILSPNAMLRPTAASDQHMALFYHLKSFAYAFHKTTLRRAVIEAQHGNYNPALSLFVGYIPVMIAADAAKEMLAPGDEPAWMKGGLGGYVSHGFRRANLLGIPQFALDASPINNPLDWTGKKGVITSNPFDAMAGLLGPAVSQGVGVISTPFTERHTLPGEIINALPGATVFNRATRDWTRE